MRELGGIERTLFILDWLQSVELRHRVHAGLNEGEARNSLTRAVFFTQPANTHLPIRLPPRARKCYLYHCMKKQYNAKHSWTGLPPDLDQ